MRETSAFIAVANCSGDPPTDSAPRLKNACFTSELLSTRATSWFNLLMIAGGVLAGAHIPVIPSTSKPGRPDAAIVGRPGTSTEGSALVTANALNLPDFT